jgi:hypothetical protein
MKLELARNGKLTPQQLRQQLQREDAPDLKRRRDIIAWSLVGMATMAAVTLLQTGIVKHLPDPQFRLGAPDGSIALASLAANIPIAAFGGANRVQGKPWVPLVAAVKAVGEALAASWYFYQMPGKEKAWCGYCIVGALSNIGIAALTLPEVRTALAVMMSETSKAE